MPDANQLLLLAVAVGLLHAAVFALVMRWSNRRRDAPRGGGDLSALAGGDGGNESPDREPRSVSGEPVGPSLDTDADTVRCPACGAENEAGYQYCRLCVSSLHGGAAAGVVDGAPASDRMGR
ncbi:MAG: hypothetical protein V5A46_07120 [Haloferacaceae archaeon]